MSIILGSAFNVFLFVEKDEKIYVIDQHAAHERILFEQLLKTSGEKQPLLFPFEFEIETESQNDYLEKIQDEMNKAGFTLSKIENSDKWQITSVPIKWQGSKQSIWDSLFEKQYEPKDFMRNFLSTCASYSFIFCLRFILSYLMLLVNTINLLKTIHTNLKNLTF